MAFMAAAPAVASAQLGQASLLPNRSGPPGAVLFGSRIEFTWSGDTPGGARNAGVVSAGATVRAPLRLVPAPSPAFTG
jgi:hypothetical protein